MIDRAYFDRLPQDPPGKLCVRLYHANLTGVPVTLSQGELTENLEAVKPSELVRRGQEHVREAVAGVAALIENHPGIQAQVAYTYAGVLKGRVKANAHTAAVLDALTPATRERLLALSPVTVGDCKPSRLQKTPVFPRVEA